jgi:DNA-binding transcriptional LysR family regulator
MVMFEKGFGNTSKNFSLERLKRLVEVLEAGYISKASGGNVTTAALISRQITELESFFEVPLREKHGKLVKLSKEGEELAIMTKRFLSSLDDFQESLDGIAPKIIVGAGQTFLTSIILPCFNEIRDSVENAKVELVNMTSSNLVDALDSGTVDLALVSERRVRKGDQKKVLGIAEYKLYAPVEWVRKVNEIGPVNAIQELPYAGITGTGERRTFVDTKLCRPDKPPNYALEVSSHNELAGAVKSGCFCALLPTFLGRELDPKKVASFTIPKLKGMQSNLCVVWKKNIYNYKPRIETVINSIHKSVKKYLA